MKTIVTVTTTRDDDPTKICSRSEDYDLLTTLADPFNGIEYMAKRNHEDLSEGSESGG